MFGACVHLTASPDPASQVFIIVACHVTAFVDSIWEGLSQTQYEMCLREPLAYAELTQCAVCSL